MQFRTYEDLNRTIIDNLYKLPTDVDLVVGIPRSGLMVALILGLYLNLPITSFDGFIMGKVISSGTSKPKKGWISRLDDARHILVVEDSIYSGNSIKTAKSIINNKSPYAAKCIYLGIYVVPQSLEIPDVYFEVVDSMRIFQWNFLTHSFLQDTCMDIDGVLCYDPTNEENDDGYRYVQFLRNAKLKLYPKRPVGYLVTSRLEKYRSETEQWLHDHNIEYGKLYMIDLPTAEERRRLGNHAVFKANIYKKLKNTKLFIESNDLQAKEIFALTNKPVFCIESQHYYADQQREHCIEKKKMWKNKFKQMILNIGIFRRINVVRKAMLQRIH